MRYLAMILCFTFLFGCEERSAEELPAPKVFQHGYASTYQKPGASVRLLTSSISTQMVGRPFEVFVEGRTLL